jgi:hypothetical protein
MTLSLVVAPGTTGDAEALVACGSVVAGGAGRIE